MDQHNNHDQLMISVAKEYQDIFANSEQGIYIYLDDQHKICNKKFAALLGYSSKEEWAKVDQSFPEVFVARESQETLISNFREAVEKNVASNSKIVWKKKDASFVSTTVILVPISYEGHLLALHFVSN